MICRQSFACRYLVSAVSILCSSFAPRAVALSLEFLSDLNIPTGTLVDGVPFGGVSGLSYDPISGTYLGICDDRSNLAPARWFTLEVKNHSGSLSVTPKQQVPLHRADGTLFPAGSIDAEGIARHPNGLIYVSSEGDGNASPRLAPSVFILDREGRVIAEAPIPAKFVPNPNGDLAQGVVNNGALEGLTLTPSGQLLIALLESPLVQDDTVATFEKGSMNRGIVYHLTPEGLPVVVREFAYPVEAAKRPNPSAEGGANGVSEILALSEAEFLVMERGGSVTNGEWRTQVRIFRVDLTQATDVSQIAVLQGQPFIPATKELVLDLDEIAPLLSHGFQSLDNLEAIAMGPLGVDGNATVLLGSDNNFNAAQRNQFLLFKLSF